MWRRPATAKSGLVCGHTAAITHSIRVKMVAWITLYGNAMKVNGVTSYPIAVTMLAQATSSTYPLCILKYSNINVNNMNNAMMKKLIANTYLLHPFIYSFGWMRNTPTLSNEYNFIFYSELLEKRPSGNAKEFFCRSIISFLFLSYQLTVGFFTVAHSAHYFKLIKCNFIAPIWL